MPKSSPHFIFVSGGVLSGLGKGITTASIGLLFKSLGYKVTAIKIDPYVSIDAGTMRPAEHGEVFVTDDGGEIDQDLGNYERFLDVSLSKDNNLTTGKIYQTVIANERAFKYKGRDVEMFPDVINEIKDCILKASTGAEIVLVEIGGTVGDLENQPFLHAVRELGREYPSAHIIVTYLPFLRNVGELKTKPTQHAVARLREAGIFPDFIVTRNEIPIDKPRIESIAARCFVDAENIIDNPDTDSIYKIPLKFRDEKFAEKLQKKLNLPEAHPDLTPWEHFVKGTTGNRKKVKIGLIGKYVEHGSAAHNDVYISVLEAVKHAAAYHKVFPEIVAIEAERAEVETDFLEGFSAIIVPQGWGARGIEGKIAAIKFAREEKIPFLGLCFGMQMASIEFGRDVCGLPDSNSEEADDKTKYPVIHIMPDQKEYLRKHQYGGTIRLGAWPCVLRAGSLLAFLYQKYDDNSVEKGTDGSLIIKERHRHRYEFNNEFRHAFEEKGLIFSGLSPDGKLVEAIEIPQSVHPFFVGTQFHPEYKSRPLKPHPVFLGLVEAALNLKR